MINTSDTLYDVIIIGGGPAGLTAALYLARAKYRVLVMEKERFGGQITITDEVVNYPGLMKISGEKLTETIYKQAENFGAEFLIASAEKIEVKGDIRIIHSSAGEYRCFGILIATGAHPKSVGFKGEAEYKGRGVAYCATCDGEFFTGKDVYVVGGGYAAAEESIFLTKFARHVTILIRGKDFSCAAAVAEKARNHEKISVLTNTTIEEVSGKYGLDYIRYKNSATGEVTEFKSKDGETFGVFVFAGYAPATSIVESLVTTNEQGYIVTDSAQMTSIEGIYAAGDVCIKPLRQIVTATGDGALAATELEKYAAKMQAATGIHPTKNDRHIEASKQHTGTNEMHTETEKVSNKNDTVFNGEMCEQLNSIFEKMEKPLLLKLYLDERPISDELEKYIRDLASLTDKLEVRNINSTNSSKTDSIYTPCVRIYREDGSDTGLAFHGVPGGHEFTSFILSLYNASGDGQKIDESTKKDIAAITNKTDIKILVTLSCSMCPDLVVAAQKIAALNPNISAEVFDIKHFPYLQEKYSVMSVPCLVINNNHVSFGKKNINEVLQIIKKC